MTLLAMSWWASCTFYIGPKLWHYADKHPETDEPRVCMDSADRALLVLSTTLSTLLALLRDDRGGPPPPPPPRATDPRQQ